jgi:hypothetical protein
MQKGTEFRWTVQMGHQRFQTAAGFEAVAVINME